MCVTYAMLTMLIKAKQKTMVSKILAYYYSWQI